MTEHVFEPMRRAMVASQLRTTGVNDPRVVAAMGELPRERFVPEERSALAYADALVPLGRGRALNPPMALGRMLSEARLRGNERALVIGAATGYSAALLARLAGSVVALEEDAALLAFAKTALKGEPVEVARGRLAGGWLKGAPYDFILIDGAVEHVPLAIVEQAADNGQISLGLVDNGVTRLAIGRVVSGAFGMNVYADAAAAILPGFERPRIFSF
ncbi:MAG TPA: protein-L-isoaspartate O-methyltransferase [Allosphingosinicella sp.]|nr:protein-L-isoaspartate O-methyltransferase [Allosphingosinicella sp.]